MQVATMSAVLLTLLSLTVSATAADPTGTWRSTVTLNGQSFETIVSFYLDSEGPTLTAFELEGASNQKVAIYKASCRRNQIQFIVVRDSPKEKLTIHYRGDVSRDVITGSAVFEYGDRSQTATWAAKRERVAGR
ncbi:MAG TPA: hypothetical protein VGI40_06575 [Pirellulaceae bacterium]|jgi:hypothetical protein